MVCWQQSTGSQLDTGSPGAQHSGRPAQHQQAAGPNCTVPSPQAGLTPSGWAGLIVPALRLGLSRGVMRGLCSGARRLGRGSRGPHAEQVVPRADMVSSGWQATLEPGAQRPASLVGAPPLWRWVDRGQLQREGSAGAHSSEWPTWPADREAGRWKKELVASAVRPMNSKIPTLYTIKLTPFAFRFGYFFLSYSLPFPSQRSLLVRHVHSLENTGIGSSLHSKL